MRKIGSLSSESQARRFTSYLVAAGMPAQADQARDGAWEVWVHDDSQLAKAAAELEQYLAEPGNARYDHGVRAAAKLEKEEQAANRKSRSKVIDARSQWGVFQSSAMGPLSVGLIFICVAIFLYELLTKQPVFKTFLMFTTMQAYTAGDPLAPIKNGQVWRVFTPVLMHGGALHLLFNMMWLRQLGSMIEYHEGTWRMAAQVLVYALVGNVLQFWLGGSPWFLGMSGVVYGLFGYIWMCAKYDPRRAYALDKETVVLMLAWFALCFTGLVGPIANYAHTGGLVAGVVWGAIVARTIPFTKIRF